MRRIATTFVILLTGGWIAVARAQEAVVAQIPAAAGSPLGPREFLKVFDIDEGYLATFADDRPMDVAEREKLLQILFRLRQFPVASLEKFSNPPDGLQSLKEHPGDSRGELFDVRGIVTRVMREELAPELRERLQIVACYRCQVIADSGMAAVIYTLTVPQVWKLNQPLDERCNARALFIKREKRDDDAHAEPNGAPDWVFVAPRMAWYPRSFLGELGMDCGLLDEVHDRTRLNERECFYQMLGAVSRADEQQIEREGQQELARWKSEWTASEKDPALDVNQRQAARRALASAERNASDIVPLFNQAQAQRGKLFVVRGEALRAIEVRVDDPDIVRRFGLRHYYELEIFTPDSQNNPLVCCVSELPSGMPRGDDIRENVCITGFFLKSWAFDAASSANSTSTKKQPLRQQLAPLLVAKTVEWFPKSDARAQSVSVAVGLIVTLALGTAVVFYLRRVDRRALAAARSARLTLPDSISLDD